MNGNRIIVHGLIKDDDKYLIIKRSVNETSYPEFWDIPGGLAELKELPKEALIREIKEEIGLKALPIKIIHEDSNIDESKDMVFIRLVYLCNLEDDINNIKLDLNEHFEYKLIDSLTSLENENVLPYLLDILKELL